MAVITGETPNMTNGQLLIGSTGTPPVAAALTAGAGIIVTPGAGSITITSSGSTPTGDNIWLCPGLQYNVLSASQSTISPVAGDVRVFRFKVSEPGMIVAAVAMEVVTTTAGKSVVIGIYDAAGTTKIGQVVFNGNSATVQNITGLSWSLPPGFYWLAASCDGNAVQARVHADQAQGSLLLNKNAVQFGKAANAMVGTTLPATLGVVTGGNANTTNGIVAVFLGG
jgi:hypothetical protein